MYNLHRRINLKQYSINIYESDTTDCKKTKAGIHSAYQPYNMLFIPWLPNKTDFRYNPKSVIYEYLLIHR